MNKQCLQNVLLPQLGICTEEKLYYRKEKKKKNSEYFFDGKLKIEKNNQVDFGTYFNGFSYGIWKKYTEINNLNLELVLKGKFKVIVYQMELINNMVIKKILQKKKVAVMEKTTIQLNATPFEDNGQVGFALEGLETDAYFYGGKYYTLCEEEVKLPRIGVDICTYKRERYVYRNFDNLKRYLDTSESSILKKQVSFYIIDNGESLDEAKLDVPNVQIIRQKDSGSTGGFTRGMIQIIEGSDKMDRILLMDDDILFEPEIIERICFFVAFIKKEYRDCIIGGGNIDLGMQWMQHESGGYFDEYGYTTLGQYYDLREPYFLLKNEYDKNATTSAWWCCCLPSDYVTNNNLPYPFFFHKEDMEYSYRNGKPIILLNGIGVWHESFFNKQPSWNAYYDIRNQLILNTLHFDEFNKKVAKKILFKNVIANIVRYRYRECEFLIEAFEDYLKGPKWLRAYDNAEYLESKIDKSYAITKINVPLNYDAYEERLNHVESVLLRTIRKITINGYLLPTNKNVIAPISSYNSYVAFRAKNIVNYDFVRQRGFITTRSHKEAIRYFFKMVKMFVKLDFRFNKMKSEYKKDFKTAIKLETWKEKLNIK